jgi:thiol:disulfide interchange protein DsbC
MTFSRSLALSALIASTLTLSMQVALADAKADEQVIRKSLSQTMANLPIDTVTPTPVKGIYQITSQGQVAYVTADGNYLFAGNLLDLKNQVNLTEQVKNKERIALLKTVPASNKVIFAADGTKKATLTILTDPTCPFCEKLHREIPALQKAGIEVQTILTPRAGAGSPGFVESSQIMCGKQREADMDTAMARKPLTGPACQDAMINTNMALAEKLGMSGTPYIILPDGTAIPGYRPAEALIAVLSGKANPAQLQ